VPYRQHYIFVCNNRRPDDAPRPSCQGRGSVALFTELKRQIDAAGLGKAVARCCQTTCLDFCDHGPSVLVEPEHLLYARVGVQDVSEIVDSLRTGQPVNRLLVDTTGPAKSDLG
jgi:(2Fe-2S) ferredoxin